MSVLIKEELAEYDVILASASPRRKELMELICGSFRVIPANSDETMPDDIDADMLPEYLSDIKCRCIASVFDNSLVIGCDTAVICGTTVLGKPIDEADAARMLYMLSGREHKVITGVTLGLNGSYYSFSSVTNVKFRELSNEEIMAYIRTGESMDKAGAYGIQGVGSLLAEKIDGDYFNVVGLPVSLLAEEIHKFLETIQTAQ